MGEETGLVIPIFKDRGEERNPTSTSGSRPDFSPCELTFSLRIAQEVGAELSMRTAPQRTDEANYIRSMAIGYLDVIPLV